MTNLRPMTTLETVTLTVKIAGGESEYKRENAVSYVSRVVFENARVDLPKWKDARKGFASFGRNERYYWEAVEINGASVSALTRLYKRLTAFQKELTKTYSWEEADAPKVQFEFQIGGDAEGYDFAKLAKEPTPQEDWDVLRKLRKKAELNNKQWGRAFWLLGLEATPIKKGRKITGFTVEGVDHNETQSNYGRPFKWTYDLDKDARAVWISKASDLLGLPDPALTFGHPPRARDYRTDLTIRTCPCCFRDIKASEHTGFRMADHGFQIYGRDWSGWGGYRTGSCKGVDRLPWEKSPDATEEMIPGLVAFSDRLVKQFKAGPPAKLELYGSQIDATHPEWATAVRYWKRNLLRALGELWNGHYGSIPWYRAAVRTWKPVADDVPAVGAPLCRPETDDFNGKPAILSED